YGTVQFYASADARLGPDDARIFSLNPFSVAPGCADLTFSDPSLGGWIFGAPWVLVRFEGAPGFAGPVYTSRGMTPSDPDVRVAAVRAPRAGGGTFTVDLGAARDDQADTGIGCGISGGRDVFYKFTLSAAEVVYFDTFGSDFDSVLRIYAGSCTALGTRQTCFDDACAVRQSQGAIQLTAGSYCLVVDQFSSTQTTGATVLTFTHGGRTGAAITPVSGSVSGDTTNTTNQSTSSSCQANVTGNDQGYYFLNCPATTRMVSAETCTTTSFDTIVTLRKGNATTTDLACSDDDCALQSNLPDITINTAGLYWFIVDGYLGAKGPFSLAYSFL
ncbi:MAG TPA: hypothetical protein PLF40_23230, partial [Kofleriaceae bacterium]|nr:hypothetical protein [Kofleriaceae bacterium]